MEGTLEMVFWFILWKRSSSDVPAGLRVRRPECGVSQHITTARLTIGHRSSFPHIEEYHNQRQIVYHCRAVAFSLQPRFPSEYAKSLVRSLCIMTLKILHFTFTDMKFAVDMNWESYLTWTHFCTSGRFCSEYLMSRQISMQSSDSSPLG